MVSLQINAVCLYVPANERIIQTNANRYIKTKLCPDVKGKHANPNLPRGTISEVYLDWLTPTNLHLLQNGKSLKWDARFSAALWSEIEDL